MESWYRETAVPNVAFSFSKLFQSTTDEEQGPCVSEIEDKEILKNGIVKTSAEEFWTYKEIEEQIRILELNIQKMQLETEKSEGNTE